MYSLGGFIGATFNEDVRVFTATGTTNRYPDSAENEPENKKFRTDAPDAKYYDVESVGSRSFKGGFTVG